MKTWEYLVAFVHEGGDLEAALDDAGKEGWELVSAVLFGSTFCYFFKRPLMEDDGK